ncbi:hypothetical protein EJV46_01020 [Roseococcus sp. SYP-B2431]|uniref:hypothetical protein n=1 Tax=Roseococcus sp. SYP-B2431 TaxID=2496640 RepID=UPI001040ACCF|nr:hypothetical protein [Roseococcus sp. SYP-B2431]TCI00754.1 hypothetical protein EJV46_01020 [Roseococcus sp. SYP-B2431]
MADRFQIVFNADGVVEMMLLEGELRTLTFDSSGSPFTTQAVEEPEVRAALHQWMVDTNVEGWIGWQELAATLQGMGIDMAAVAARYPG